MKFIHMADCHIGAWRDPKMRELTHEAFTRAIDRCLDEKPDFVLIAGDLFHTAIPGIDSLKITVQQLQRLKEASIPVYCIAGSHDYSPSGKTMLDVLEEAGLLRDVMRGEIKDGKLHLKLTADPKTGIKLTGILGKRGSLDRCYYEDLDRESLEKESGGAGKVFLFHTSITELKPKEMEKMESSPASFLPKGFDYYAGGHVHITEDVAAAEAGLGGNARIAYPGPIFPASFSELEKLGSGSFIIVEDWKLRREKIKLKDIVRISIDADKRNPKEVNVILSEKLASQDVKDALVLLRISGELREGRVGDDDINGFFESSLSQGAYFVMRNTTRLTSKEYEEIVSTSATADELEDSLIR